MDNIRLFISDILLQVLISNNFQFFDKEKLSLCRNFYDIDEYVTWAEKYLSRIVSHHLSRFFKDDIPFDDYIQISSELRTDPTVLHDIRRQLNHVFPFMQRIYHPEKLVFAYIDMLETLHDTLKIEKESFIIPPRDKKLVELSTEDMDEDSLEFLPSRDVELPAEEPSATFEEPSATFEEPSATFEEPSATFEEPANTLENATSDTPIIPVTNQPDDDTVSIAKSTVDDTDQSSEKSNESTSNTPAVEQPVTTKRARVSRATENQRQTKAKCVELGIVYKNKHDSTKLFEEYVKGTIDPSYLTIKGLKLLIKQNRPLANCSGKTRDKLVELFYESLKTLGP